MKTSIFLTLLVFLFMAKAEAEDFQDPKSSPQMKIISVIRDVKTPDTLCVTVEFSTQKTGPYAITQDQVSVHISTKNEPYLFVGDVTFEKEAPKTLLIKPEHPLRFTLQVEKNRHGNKESWSTLADGQYELQVYVNSGKDREFDYHWLGQTYSNPWKLRLPIKRK